MISEVLFICGTLPFILLGTAHILFNLIDLKNPSKIVPVKEEITELMKSNFLKITKETTIWKAWVGFNISHGIGALFFGTIYMILAATDYSFLKNNTFLIFLAQFVSLIYFVLAVKYWFRIPVIGTLFGLICFILSGSL